MDADTLYKALSNAETAGEKNPFIRTRVIPKKGSTAFGPVQITNTLAGDKYNGLSPESAEFYKAVMLPMYENFLKHGQNKGKIEGYDPVYDYGGTGYFDTEKYQDAYERMAKELIQTQYENAGRDVTKFLRKWRGTDPEQEYLERFYDGLKQYGLGDAVAGAFQK